MFVYTDEFRDAAFHLYTSPGFQVDHRVELCRKDFAVAQPGA